MGDVSLGRPVARRPASRVRLPVLRRLSALLLCGALLGGCEGGGAPPAGPSAPSAPAPPAASSAAAAAAAPPPAAALEHDVISTSGGDLVVTPVHHGTVLLEHGGKRVVVDPWSEGPVDKLPKADLVLITDIHSDHLDPQALALVRKADTVVVAPPAVAEKVEGVKVLKNGEEATVLGLRVEAVPMYNLVRGPKAGQLFHDKGRGNGYVVTFADQRVYLSGDTECTDEMKALKDIDVAFVCMNLPYTMPPEEAAACVAAFKPKIVYPYHSRGSNLDVFAKGVGPGVDVRIRNFYR